MPHRERASPPLPQALSKNRLRARHPGDLGGIGAVAGQDLLDPARRALAHDRAGEVGAEITLGESSFGQPAQVLIPREQSPSAPERDHLGVEQLRIELLPSLPRLRDTGQRLSQVRLQLMPLLPVHRPQDDIAPAERLVIDG